MVHPLNSHRMSMFEAKSSETAHQSSGTQRHYLVGLGDTDTGTFQSWAASRLGDTKTHPPIVIFKPSKTSMQSSTSRIDTASWGTTHWLVSKPVAILTNHPGWLIQRHCLVVCLGRFLNPPEHSAPHNRERGRWVGGRGKESQKKLSPFGWRAGEVQ